MEKKKQFKGGTSFAVSYLLMAIIPMAVCGIFFYPRTRNQIVERTNTSSMQQVERGLEELDRQLQIINNIPNVFFQNEEINRSDLEIEPWKNLVISNEIKKTIVNNGLIEEVFLYARKHRYFFSGYQGNFPLDKLQQYGGTVGFHYEDWEMSAILDTLETLNGTCQRPAETTILRGNLHKNIITFISTIPQKNRFAYAATMVMVDGDQLAGLLPDSQAPEGYGYLILDSNQKMIYRSSGINDSLFHRITNYGISKAVQHRSIRLEDNCLLNAAQSDSSGWILIKVTNLAPMMQEILELEYSVIFVMLGLSVVLGFLGYYFMMLNFRPLELILLQLKQNGNNRKGKIRNACYEEIERAIRILQEDNSRMSGSLQQTRPRLKKHLFSELISDSFKKGHPAEYLAELETAGFAVNEEYYRIMVIQPPSEEERDVIFSEVSCEAKGFLYMFSMPNSGSILFLFGDREEGGKASFAEWYGECGQMNQTRAGVGDKVDSLLKISQSYSQACAALDYALLSTDKGAVVYYDDLPDSMFQVHSYPLELIESLAFAVKTDKIEDTENLMYQIEYMIRMKEFPPYYIRALFFNVVSIFMEKQKKAEEPDQLEPAAMRILSQQLSSVQMIEILNELYQMFRKKADAFHTKENEWMAQVRLYIGEHYGESTLSLAEVASHIGMSPTWFSTLFKEKSGCNFKEYVDLIRLEKAKELLENSEMKIEKVAERVGYNSSYSFARFFKKHMGVSPKEYRDIKVI